jgi:hypothetical protein
MKTGYFTKMHKKGDKRNGENCRCIDVTNPFIQIPGNPTKNWIVKRHKGNEEHSGFTKGRSTVSHIFLIR